MVDTKIWSGTVSTSIGGLHCCASSTDLNRYQVVANVHIPSYVKECLQTQGLYVACGRRRWSMVWVVRSCLIWE